MNTEKFIDQIKKNSREYGSIPFWSWNDRLDPEELRRQIGHMQEIGMHGFFMHARGGLETEYLSDDWFDCIRACTDEAKKRGMEAWSYDENGWPSGFAGGILLDDEKNHAHFLTCTEEDSFDGDAYAVFVRDGDRYRRVDAPDGVHTGYCSVRIGTDSSYVDTFDRNVTLKFIAATHARYKKEVGDDFGKAMPGFFTDEPQYYRYATPWSDTFPGLYKELYGRDVRDDVIALFRKSDGYKEIRYDYHLMMHNAFINNFIKTIYDWCHENGCRITGHAVEESALFAQMWCCGGIMPFYQYEDIPGVDYLGRPLGTDISGKQLGSVCAQTGRKKAISEMFACCGWDVSPLELKKIAELQYASGVNVMCQHLCAYSNHGQRKRDYPADHFEHNTWSDSFGEFNNYFTNLGYILSRGEEKVNTLVIHPIRSCYLTYNRAEDYESVKDIEDAFRALTAMLSDRQVAYHYGDETMLAQLGCAEGASVKLGLCRYDYVIIPKTETLDGTTVNILREYVRNGGRLWLYDGVPERMDGRLADLSFLKSTCTADDIFSSGWVRFTGGVCKNIKAMTRQTDEGKIVYILNLSGSDAENLEFTVRDCKGLVRLSPDTLGTTGVNSSVRGEETVFTLSLADGESAVLIESDEHIAALTPDAKPFTLPDTFEFAAKPVNTYIIDTVSYSTDGGLSWSDVRSVMGIKDVLLHRRYKGKLLLRYSFDVKDIPSSLGLVWEPLRNENVSVNGNTVTGEVSDWPDKAYRRADIAGFVRTGRNEIVHACDYFQRDYVYYVLYGGVSESLRNCLCFDTEIECMMLYGDFAVSMTQGRARHDRRDSEVYDGTGFTLVSQKDTVDFSDTVNDGYPFFAGKMKIRTQVPKGIGNTLSLPGRYATCEVKINGKYAGKMMFFKKLFIGGALDRDMNEIELTVTGTNRNLLGPHHCTEPEPYSVSPMTFSFEGRFDADGKSENYLDGRYSFVRFGKYPAENGK